MNLHLGKMLGGIAGYFHLYNFFSKIGIEAFFYRRCYSEQIKISDEYFHNNELRIVRNLELFFDEQSKKTYKKAIGFRRTHYLRDRAPYCREKEYFNSIIPIRDNEVFIDCGGFTGDSVIEFLNFTNGMYKKIVSFEPDQANYVQEKDNLSNIDNCIVYNSGVWCTSTKLRFEENNTAGSKVEESGEGGVVIDAVAIDDMEECNDATFIKMDVEGSELMALKGAYNTIIKNRPILAICIYHSDEDMLSIPEWISENLHNYRFYCRHHSYYMQETILYAVPDERI